MEVTEKVISWPKELKVELAHFHQNELPKEWLEVAYAQKWFKVFVSKRYQGRGSSLSEGLKVLFESGAIHPSLGWCVNLGAGANYFSGFFEHQGAKRIFTREDVVLAGSGGLASKFERVDGGFRVTGNWKKATGAAHATHFTLNGQTDDGKTISCALNRDQVTIHEDWGLFGLKPTSSIGFSAENAFVPDESTFEINVFKNSYRTDVHSLPFELFARFSMSASFLGIAKGLADKIEEAKIEKSKAIIALAALQQKINQFYEELLTIAEETEEVAKRKKQNFPEIKMQELSGKIGFEIFMEAQKVYFHVGLLMADEKALVHHYFKDLMLAAQHSFLK